MPGMRGADEPAGAGAETENVQRKMPQAAVAAGEPALPGMQEAVQADEGPEGAHVLLAVVQKPGAEDAVAVPETGGGVGRDGGIPA